MFDRVMLLAMLLLAVSIGIALYRIMKGPTVHDRILALDSIGYLVIGIVAVHSIMLDSRAYLETILLIGILAFLSTVALSKYMEGGVVSGTKNGD
ncbi:Na(+)/H(+) antiporter subunit F1 [Paenibacillaceae bacterium WGS1546]|uniref:Na(+)/H(+) antiporter subunit F1 n=1 Tax=Cohnella sp. WGS1546 TaxID=3366810 RepID=UPI00372D7417